jgi:AcrR family transcriptional regulator
MPATRRGRPPFPRDVVLAAADRLFSEAPEPKAISMDDVAAAAGVGKATLFRAFGSRDGLLDALFASRLAPLRAEQGRWPTGDLQVDPAERLLAVLDGLLSFKLENPKLAKARELTGSRLLEAPHYVWVHDLIRTLLEDTGAAPGWSDYVAHVLLGALRADVLDALLAGGRTPADIRRDVAGLAHQLLGTPVGATAEPGG